MAMNKYVGLGIYGLLTWFASKGSSGSEDQSDSEPDDLSVTETETGTPIPVVIGRALIKRPLITFFGDFRADRYTETYAAHANFSAWPLILSALLGWLLKPKTGNSVTSGEHSHPQAGFGGSHAHAVKETEGPSYLMMLAQWLLSWLINGRNLKTTIQKGFKYYLGFQMLCCYSGPNMRVRSIYLGQTKVWEGDISRDSVLPGPANISVNNEELFGGPDENGGFVGNIHVYLGGDNQQSDAWMKQQMSASSVQQELRGLTPAYRPYVSLVVPTAYIGKSSTIPEVWVELQDQPNALGLGGIGEDANPAEAIYYLHTNTKWGLGESPDSLDLDSLKAIGKTLKDEGIGVTIVIKEITDAKTLINAILEHINGVRYVEPATGKLTFRLIRDDYDAATLPVMDETLISSVSMTRLDWRETVGSVSVTYTDRSAVYEQSSLEDNDPAVIEIAQNKTTKTYSYLYFTTAANALWAAKRECQEQGYPLSSLTIKANRKLSSLRIGDVRRMDWPPLGIKNMIVRVTDIDLGDFINGEIVLDALEDVFSLGKTDFGFSGSTNWNPEAVLPAGVQNYRFMESPWELMPELNSYVYALAAQPDAFTQRWTVWRNSPAMGWSSTNSLTNWTPAGRLVYDYSEKGDVIDTTGFTLVSLGNLDRLHSASLTTGAPDIVSARRGGKYLIVNGEIMAWSKLEELSNGHWAVSGIIRGVMDTVPKTHHGGDVVYFIDSSRMANVTTGGPVCLQGETVSESYNITTATADAEESFDYLKARTLDTIKRSMRPNPPGKIRMNDRNNTEVRFIDRVSGDLSISFVPRNKARSYGAVSQDDIQDYWSGLAIEKPDGLTYVVRVVYGTTVLHEYEIADGPFSLTWAERATLSTLVTDNTIIRIYSKLDGLLSAQCHEREFAWVLPGLVDACTDSAQAASRLAAWKATDRVVIPAGTVNLSSSQVLFAELPFFILGTVGTAGSAGAIRSYDGSYVVPNGNAVVVKPDGTTEEVALPEGFLFSSPYVPEANGGIVYYKIIAGGVAERVMEV